MGDSPPITLYGVQILEPVTSLTDFITALVCFYAFYRLSKLEGKGKMYQYFRYYFLCTGIATTCAAFIGHAFLYLFSFEWKMVGWAFSATGILLMEWGTLFFVRREIPSRVFQWTFRGTLVKYLAFWALILTTQSFLATQAQAAIGLVGIVLPLQVYHYLRTRHPGSRAIIIALLFSLLPAVTYNTKLSFHTYFNHHDISHLLMAICLFLIYRGVHQILDFKPNMIIGVSHSQGHL
ncbi:hypothetical protein [Phaeodactylibacter sp.]|uniref:DUF6962 family protein n=1 Tax=Phaeodactylibacter sp. TaxID=1940289 RepID=UPI0025E47532|nr:hypothetical protein [Phaeodactylibacter sp.]MCI4649698.1 hypothetical protein [Phaeodactylibacter sp.]MCI5092080.1 hypothetical protein [Phaeodactylibacter sp.]